MASIPGVRRVPRGCAAVVAWASLGLAAVAMFSSHAACVACDSVGCAEQLDAEIGLLVSPELVVAGARIEHELRIAGDRVAAGTLVCTEVPASDGVEVVACDESSNADGSRRPQVGVQKNVLPSAPVRVRALGSVDPADGYPEELVLTFEDGTAVVVTYAWGPNDDEACAQPCSRSVTSTARLRAPSTAPSMGR